jgi:hypothetical protein
MIYIIHLDRYKLITEVVYQNTNLDNVIKYILSERLSSEFMPEPENDIRYYMFHNGIYFYNDDYKCAIDITYNFTDTKPLISTTNGIMLKKRLIVFLRESKLHELGI